MNAATEPALAPVEVVVFCDGCGTADEGEYLVREDDDLDARLGHARAHLALNAGWQCDEGRDLCPGCKKKEGS